MEYSRRILLRQDRSRPSPSHARSSGYRNNLSTAKLRRTSPAARHPLDSLALPWPHTRPEKSPRRRRRHHHPHHGAKRVRTMPRGRSLAGDDASSCRTGRGPYVPPSLATKREREGEATPVSRPRAGLHYPLPCATPAILFRCRSALLSRRSSST